MNSPLEGGTSGLFHTPHADLAGVSLKALLQEPGHESLATTQKYLANVRRPDEAKKAVAESDFVPKPKVVIL
jgi:hypothetical protein